MSLKDYITMNIVFAKVNMELLYMKTNPMLKQLNNHLLSSHLIVPKFALYIQINYYFLR